LYELHSSEDFLFEHTFCVRRVLVQYVLVIHFLEALFEGVTHKVNK